MAVIWAGILALPFAFWLLAFCTLVVTGLFMDRNREGWGTLSFIAGAVACYWVYSHGAFDVIGWVKAHYVEFLVGFAVYLVFGAAYGVLRYVLTVHDIADKLKRWAGNRKYDLGALTKTQARNFAYDHGLARYPIQLVDYRSRILNHMMGWPISAPWWLLHDPVARFFRTVYNRLAGVLQSYTDRVFQNVTIVEDEPAKPKSDKRPLQAGEF